MMEMDAFAPAPASFAHQRGTNCLCVGVLQQVLARLSTLQRSADELFLALESSFSHD
jgi:hypothetical protein